MEHINSDTERQNFNSYYSNRPYMESYYSMDSTIHSTSDGPISSSRPASYASITALTPDQQDHSLHYDHNNDSIKESYPKKSSISSVKLPANANLSRKSSFENLTLNQPRFAAAHLYEHPNSASSQVSVASSLKFAAKFPEPPLPHKPRWTNFKIILVSSIIFLLIYGIIGLIGSTFTWMSLWKDAQVVQVANTQLLTFITIASCLCVVTALIGLCGAILNNRSILSIYCFMLWPCFAFIATVGYLAYKRKTFALTNKLDEQWSRFLNDYGKLVIQNSLHCCGYKTPLHQAVASATCYVRTPLPGCKFKFLQFERKVLPLAYTIAFSLIPIHIINIIISLVCSNHVNNLFGKGLTPKQYRLNMNDVQGSIFNMWNDFSADMQRSNGNTHNSTDLSGSGAISPRSPNSDTSPMSSANLMTNRSRTQLASMNGANVRRRYD